MFIKEDECCLFYCFIMYIPPLGINESHPGGYVKDNVKKKSMKFHDVK